MTDQSQRQRRRGEELEAALLAVLYRRWPRKDDLVLAAIAAYSEAHPVEIPDTGSLRGDMVR